MLKSKSLPILAGAAGLALSVGIASPASATLTFDLTQSNIGFSGNLVEVDITRLTSTTATITFKSLVSGGDIFLLGDGGSVGVNVSGAFSLGSISGSNAGTGFTPGPYSDGGAGNEDGFGSFNQTINSDDGFTHSSDTITFGLNAISGNTWATDSAVLTPNAAGFEAAAHIFVTSSPANAANGAIITGFATTPAPVIGHGLPGVLAVGGVLLFGAKLFERSRKRRSPGTALPYAAA